MDYYYTLKELHDRTGISTATLRRWCANKEIFGAWQTAGVWFVPKKSKLPEIKAEGKRAPAYGNKKRVEA